MVNKNDLRFVKTEALIRSTYLILLENKRGIVTVTELCGKALINKSTFYSHYDSISALHNAVCREKIHEILSADNHGIKLFFVDTRIFFETINVLFSEYSKDLNLLFPNWIDMVDPFEEELLRVYDSVNISEEQKCILRFCLGGILRLMSTKNPYDYHDMVLKLVEKCVAV